MNTHEEQTAEHWQADHVPLRQREAVASLAAIAGHPIHPMLIPFPIAFLVFAFVADVAYAMTSDEFFARMALWMVTSGLVTGVLAAIAGLVDFVGLERPRQLRTSWIHAIGNGVVLGLTVANLVGRIVDGEEFVVPWGLAVSAVIGLLLAVTGWFGGELSYRHLIGVDPTTSNDDRPARRELG
jgi:uncharacterized membrane protein